MAVLGPIASEPRMVANQREQVQVLRDEFGSQMPQLNQLNHTVEMLLDRVDINSPDARDIKKKLSAVNKHWQGLLNELDDREDNLTKATGASKDFHEGISRLQIALQKIADDFDSLSEIGGSNIEDKLDQLQVIRLLNVVFIFWVH